MNVPLKAAAVIPARDGLPDVLDAVGSALGQTLPPSEVIVVDDDSHDGTGVAVERRFGDRVRIVRGRYGGAAAARNAGWRAAEAPWVAFLDADDLWFPDKLETVEKCLAEHRHADWFFSDGAFRTLEGETVASWIGTWAELAGPYVGRPLAELLEVNFVLTSSVVVRREVLEEEGGFDERMSHGEDLDLWIRLSRRSTVVGSPRALVRYQHRSGGLTRQVESRVMGDIVLFGRLAADQTLPAPLRRRARRRKAMSHFKLAVEALREGRPGEARRQLRGAWMFPGRSLPVAAAWGASLLPRAVLEGVRTQPWIARGIAAPMVRPRRVVLGEKSGVSAGLDRRGS